MDAIISASASPALTSPPTVFIRNNTPLILSSFSIAASCGRICSYLVVLLVAGRLSCPSISPIIVISLIALPSLSPLSVTCPSHISVLTFSSSFISYHPFDKFLQNICIPYSLLILTILFIIILHSCV